MASMFEGVPQLVKQLLAESERTSAPKAEVPTSDKQVNRRSTQINNSGVRYNNMPTVDINAEKWKGLL
jgi:hypothetical protein